jgi:hypothetical protein
VKVGKLKELLKEVDDNFDIKIKAETGSDSWGINYEEYSNIELKVLPDEKICELDTENY